MLTTGIIRTINADIQEALNSIAQKHNLKMTLGNYRYSDVDYTIKLKVETAGSQNKKVEESKRVASLYGLPEDIIGKEFTMDRKRFKVVRLDIGKPKNPVIISKEGSDLTYKMSVETLKRNLK